MITYKDAGVDIAKADSMLNGVAHHIKSTHDENVLDTGNDFASLYKIPKQYINPVMVSATDGVGTKLNLAIKMNNLDTIGTDLVAMCVNDLITTGADPLTFLDYYATSQLSTEQATRVITSIANACVECKVSLVGGETAEMPRMYNDGDFDLAGFATGLVNEHSILSPDNVNAGDSIIGIQSSGFHSNGYSLINKILETQYPTDDVIEMLLEPTRLYHDVMRLTRDHINSAAHITGGGLFANITRAIPNDMRIELDESSWTPPAVYKEFSIYHELTDEVMYGTFNQGIGFVLIVDPSEVDGVLDQINFPSWVIGEVRAC